MAPAPVDVETSEAIERLGGRIDALDVSLRTEIREGLAESRAEFRKSLAESRIELRAEFREALAESRIESRAELREDFAESRRHAEVLFESLRDDIRILAEGFGVLSAKLESLRR